MSVAPLLLTALLLDGPPPSDHLEVKAHILPGEQRIEAEVGYTFHAHQPDTREVGFFLASELEVEAVEGAGVTLAEDRSSDSFLAEYGTPILLHLEPALQPGEAVTVQFRYAGRLPEAFHDGWVELYADRLWVPLEASVFRRASFAAQVQAPPEYMVVGQGDVRRVGDGRWEVRSERAGSDVPLILATGLRETPFTEDGLEVRVSHRPDVAADMVEQVGRETLWALRYFNEGFGQARPHSQVRMVIRPEFGGPGYARPGYIVVEPTGDAATSLVPHFKYFAHEVSHLWWLRGNPGSWENWLNESFAEYSSLLALRARFGDEPYDQRITRLHQTVPGLPPIRGTGRDSPVSHRVYYSKGCLVLHELADFMGPEEFEEMLGVLVEEQTSSTADLLTLLEEVFGPEAAGFLRKKLEE